MKPRHERLVRALTAFILIVWGWTISGPGRAHEYVPQEEEGFPRIRFSDGQLSLNDRCPVRGGKLNLKMDPLYVNGRPVGFC